MRHDIRKGERHPLWGHAGLKHGDATINGRVVDISSSGIAIVAQQVPAEVVSARNTWLCEIEARDLPTTLRCLVRIVRRKPMREGYRLGCAISLIDDQNLNLLKAHRSLALARRTPILHPLSRQVLTATA
jgi:hypothetical protein